MAASRASAVQAFESRFPIVAANLRALVSSWLPPARDPSPVDSHSTHKEEPSAGRIERLALGATPTVSQNTSVYQNRMNRRMGLSSLNGITPKKTAVSASENASNALSAQASPRKRKPIETDSDSEEDSKTKLISKLGQGKRALHEQPPPKKKKSKKNQVHPAISQSHEKPVCSPATPNPPNSPSKYSTAPEQAVEKGQVPSVVKEASMITIFSSTTEEAVVGLAAKVESVEELNHEERKRLKKEAKKAKRERMKLKKLAEATG